LNIGSYHYHSHIIITTTTTNTRRYRRRLLLDIVADRSRPRRSNICSLE